MNKNNNKSGIISFIIAMIAIFNMISISIIDIIFPMNLFDRKSLLHIFTTISFAITMYLVPFGLGLGISTVIEKDKRNRLATIGVIINGLFVICGLIFNITSSINF